VSGLVASLGSVRSWWVLPAVAALVFAATLGVAWMLFGAAARRAHERKLARKLAVGARPGQLQATPELASTGWMPQGVVDAAERMAGTGKVRSGIERRLERAGVSMRPGEIVAGSLGLGFLGFILGLLVLGSPLFALIIGGGLGAVPHVLLGVSAAKRMRRMQEQIPDTLSVIASSLRAGHSFFQALDTVSKQIGEPAASEFSRVVAEVRLGRPVEQALDAMADRIGSDDLKWAMLAVNVQRQVGGNLAEILDTVAETVRERAQIRRQVDTLSAEGRISMKILIGLPFVVALYIAKVNPGYMKQLFTTGIGLIMLVGAAVMMVVGVLWMRKVVKIDV
jgi:tight adherence protein B